MKAISALIVIAVIGVVAGVAWFRSARDGTSADPPATAVSPTATRPAPPPDAAPPKEGALCPEPPPTSQAAAAPAPGANAVPTPATVNPAPATNPVAAASATATRPAATNHLPRIVDLGADKCIPCKKLAPILEELKKEYAGRVTVDFIDVWKDPKAGEPYKFRVIPTQIFFDRDGKEVWRHEGFLPKEDFIAKFAELGVK